MYKEVVLDESILDLDSWIPQSAVDEVVALILKLEGYREAGFSVSSKQTLENQGFYVILKLTNMN